MGSYTVRALVEYSTTIGGFDELNVSPLVQRLSWLLLHGEKTKCMHENQ